MNPIVFNALKTFAQENIIVIFLGLILLVIAITYWVARVNERQGTFSTNLTNLDTKITGLIEEIQRDIKGILRAMPSLTTESQSPVQLTTLGKEIAEEIQAMQWVPERAQALKKDIGKLNAYDIQERCFDYAQRELLSALSQTQADAIKLSAYQHGLEISAVLEVAGVLLRDKVLELLGAKMGVAE